MAMKKAKSKVIKTISIKYILVFKQQFKFS